MAKCSSSPILRCISVSRGSVMMHRAAAHASGGCLQGPLDCRDRAAARGGRLSFGARRRAETGALILSSHPRAFGAPRRDAPSALRRMRVAVEGRTLLARSARQDEAEFAHQAVMLTPMRTSPAMTRQDGLA